MTKSIRSEAMAAEMTKRGMRRPEGGAPSERGHRATAEEVLAFAARRLDEMKKMVPPRKALRSQIEALEPKIRDLMESGWGTDEIAKALTESGIPIAAGTLKNHLSRIAREREAMYTEDEDDDEIWVCAGGCCPHDVD